MIPKFVICGIEHSGTTLLSDLFRQADNLDSGFEVGVLLSNSPREFRHLENFRSQIASGWGIEEDQISEVCDCDTFSEFYQRLYDLSRVIQKPSEIFDKTPRYLAKLEECSSKLDVPFISMYKDPKSIVHSDFCRSGTNDFNDWYSRYLNSKLSYMRTLYSSYVRHTGDRRRSDRVRFVSLEEICLNAGEVLRGLFEFVEVDFSVRYLLLDNLRYKHTHGRSIDVSDPFKYLKDFDPQTCALIDQDFAEFEHWFYRP